MTEPQQGASYDELLACARAAEDTGFDGFFRSDHLLAFEWMGTPGGPDGAPGPTDAWVTLAGLARDTERIRLGTLVTSMTFRRPGPLAIAVAQIDAMSDGRVELGLGAGWFDTEHSAYGVPFPPTGERFDQLAEQLEVITGLWATPEGETFSFAGEHYPLTDSPALPKPQQRPGPPIIIGGHGPRRTPALAARFADEFNVPMVGIDDWQAQCDRVRAACAARDRDPTELRYSAMVTACVGADEAEFARRAEITLQPVDQLRQNAVAGTVEEARARVAAWAAVGCERLYLQVLDPTDLDHVALIGAELSGIG